MARAEIRKEDYTDVATPDPAPMSVFERTQRAMASQKQKQEQDDLRVQAREQALAKYKPALDFANEQLQVARLMGGTRAEANQRLKQANDDIAGLQKEMQFEEEQIFQSLSMPPAPDSMVGPAPAETMQPSAGFAAPPSQGRGMMFGGLAKLRDASRAGRQTDSARAAMLASALKQESAAKEKALSAQQQVERDRQKTFQQMQDMEAGQANYMRELDSRQRQERDKIRQGIKKQEEAILNFKIDPNRAFPTVGQRIAAALAVGLGAYSSAISRGAVPNAAKQIIDDAIRRDIDAQKVELQNRKFAVSNKHNVLAQLFDEHGDMKRAEREAFVIARTAVNRQLDQLTSRSKDIRLQQTKDLIVADQEREKAAILKDIFAGSYQRTKAEVDAQVRIGGALMQDESRQAAMMAQGPASTGVKLTAKQREKLDIKKKIVKGLKQMKEQSTKFGNIRDVPLTCLTGVSPNSEAVRSFDAGRTMAVGLIMKDIHGSQFTDADRAMVEEMLPTAGQFDVTKNEMIDALLATYENDLANQESASVGAAELIQATTGKTFSRFEPKK